MTRGQRISKAELIRESREVLDKAGVRRHSRAEFLKLVSAAVHESDNPLFLKLKPTVHSQNSNAWTLSYSFILQYLTQFNLNSTLETFERESQTPITPAELEDPLAHIPPAIPFKDRVDALAPRFKRPPRSPSPRAAKKRKPRTPLQKRPTKPASTTPRQSTVRSPVLKVTSPSRSRPTDFDIDFVVEEIIEKPKRKQ
jgi:hypothetical protein